MEAAQELWLLQYEKYHITEKQLLQMFENVALMWV